jgi:hypothetical protein
VLPNGKASVLATWSDDELCAAIRDRAEDLKAYLEEAVRRGWSQRRIGEALGIGQPAVSKRMAALGVAPKQIQSKHIPQGIRSTKTEIMDDWEGEVLLDTPSEIEGPRREPRKPRRRPLTDDLIRARLELLRVTKLFTRLAEDDRFGKNLTHVSTFRSDLVRARDVMQSVIDRLPAPEPLHSPEEGVTDA